MDASLEFPLAEPRNREENRVFRRESLIRAAILTVAKYDLTGATVARICRAAGVSRGLIGHYFESKEALLVQASDETFDNAISIKRQIAADPNLDPVVKLKALSRSSFEAPIFSREDIAAWQAFTNASRSQAPFKRSIERASQALQEIYEPIFAEAVAACGADLDPARAAFGLVTVLDGLWNSLATGKDQASLEDAVFVAERYIDGCLQQGSHL